MSTSTIPDRYREKINGVLQCYDRLILTGTMHGLCYAEGMTGFLKARGIRVFDYADSPNPNATPSATTRRQSPPTFQVRKYHSRTSQ